MSKYFEEHPANQVQTRLEAERQRYRDLFQFAPNSYAITNTSGVIKEANYALADLLNVNLIFLTGKPLAVFIDMAVRQVFRTNLNQIVRDRVYLSWTTIIVPRRQHSLTVQVNVSFVHQLGVPLQLRWSFRDRSQQTVLEEVLSLERQRLQVLSRNLVEAQEAERRRLAGELHDEIGQLLTGLKLSLTYSSQQTLVSETKISDALSLVDEIMRQVRELSLQLRPPTLETLGLLATLDWLFERYTSQTQIIVHFTHATLKRGQRFSSQVEITAYRIIQEALTNVARHAQVKEVCVQIELNVDVLHCEVEDRGSGFDEQAAQGSPTGAGLAGMRERVDLVGGYFSVTSKLNEGTRIVADLYLGDFQ